MDVVFQAHNAVISDRMKERATRAVRKIAQRLDRVVDVTVRFHQDGPVRRVELRLNAPGRRDLVSAGEARYYGPALNVAIAHLESQVGHERQSPKEKGRRVARV